MYIITRIGGSIVLSFVYLGQIVYLIYNILIAFLANLYQCWFEGKKFNDTKFMISVVFPNQMDLFLLGIIGLFFILILVGFFNDRRIKRLRKIRYQQKQINKKVTLPIISDDYQLNMYKVKRKYKSIYKKRLQLIKNSNDYKFINYDMSDDEFEHYVGYLFFTNGFNPVTITQKNTDYGLDIITAYQKCTYGVQCKHYMPNNHVSNSAVQAAVSGTLSYGLDKAIVVTTSSFTDSAIKQAKSSGVILIDGEELQKIELEPKRLFKTINQKENDSFIKKMQKKFDFY